MSRGKQEPAIVIGIDAGGNSDDAGAAVSTGNAGSGVTSPEQPGPGLIIVDPATIDGSAGSGGSGDEPTGSGAGSTRRRRGRPAGSRNGTRSAKGSSLNVNAVEAILFSSHAMLAGIFHAPELMIEKEEAADLAKAIEGVGRHYDMDVPAKTLDWTNLVMVIGRIEGTRIAAMLNNRRAARTPEVPKPKAASGGPTGLVDIPGVGKVAI